MPHCIVTKRSIHRWHYLIFLNFWLHSQSPFNLWGHVVYGWFLGEMEALTWKICWSSYCIFLCERRLYETLGHSISKVSPYIPKNYICQHSHVAYELSLRWTKTIMRAFLGQWEVLMEKGVTENLLLLL